ncbi:hypothetical protein JCM6882_009362 [Rhodosporidiobolus microsporus]
MPGPHPPQIVLIVGAGEFGSTTALALAEGPYKGHGDLITVIDRGVEPPAVDAASSDYNKVRADYSDPVYQKLALEAIEQWRTPRWSHLYHECGTVVCCGTEDSQVNYVHTSHRLNQQSHPKDVTHLAKGKDIKALYKPGVRTGDFEGMEGYGNHAGGWAATRDACLHTLNLARALGVRIQTAEADSIITAPAPSTSTSSHPIARGVRTVDGREFTADVTVLACGSWMPRLLPELATSCLSTGQAVITILLNKEERERYKDMPISFFMDSGFYCFPPNKDGILKMAIHNRGLLAPMGNLPSHPRTKLSKGYENQGVPAASMAELKRGMKRVHPELGEWIETKLGEERLCWYSDRESGDFLVDYHPSYAQDSLFVAGGGSGHGAKFHPLVGGWAVSRMQGTLDPELCRLWAFYEDKSRLDKSRGEGPIIRRDLDTGKIVEVKTTNQDIVRAKL